MSDTLLTYAILTQPDPIQAGSQNGEALLATLIIVVSNNTHQPIDCSAISFSFLKGANAKDFFSDDTGIGTTVPSGWSIAQADSLFTATPDTVESRKISAGALAFVLSNIKVNEQPGTTNLTITEHTGAGGHTATLVVPLKKSPAQFDEPQIKLFQGAVTFEAPAPKLVFTWDTDKAGYCTITGDPHMLSPSSTDGSYHLELTLPEELNKFYTLKALNNVGSQSSALELKFAPALLRNIEFEGIGSVAVSPDGVHLYVLFSTPPNDDPYVRLLNPQTFEVLGQNYGVGMRPNAIATSPDGKRVYVAEGDFHRVRAFDETLQDIDVFLDLPEKSVSLAVSPDSALLYINDAAGTLRMVDAHTLQVIQSHSLSVITRGVAVSLDGTRLYLAHGVDTGHGSEYAALLVLDAHTLSIEEEVRPFPDRTFTRFGDAMALGLPNMILVSTTDKADPLVILDRRTLQPIELHAGEWITELGDFTVTPDFKSLYAVCGSTLNVFSTFSIS